MSLLLGIARMTSFRELLAIPAQRRLLLAALPADFADWLDYVAIIALIVYVWGHGPLPLAFLALAFTLPYVLIGPLLAAWVDRTDLRSVLLLSNLGRAVMTFALVVVPNVEVLLVVILCRATVDSVFTPGRQATLQLITPEPLLMAANGLHQGINQISKIIGPALGGLLVALMPVQGVFAINGALSLLAFIVLLGIRLPPRQPDRREHENVVARLTGGFSEFLGNPKLLTVLIFAAAANFTFFLYDTQIALLTAGFGYDAGAFGLTVTASGLGGLLAAFIAGAAQPRRPLAMMALPAVLSGPAAIAIALAAIYGVQLPFLAFCLAMALMGGSTVFMLVPYRSVLQREAPPDRIARVTAAGEAVMIGAMMAAPFLGSLISATFGVPAAFLTGGVLLGLLGLIALVFAFRR